MVTPYLNFSGHCEEAFEFYASVLGGKLVLNRFAGSPMESYAPSGDTKKVLHAALIGPAGTLMGSDGGDSDGEPNRVWLSVTVDEAEASRIYDGLCVGGAAIMPLGDGMSGGKFGMLTDKYGFTWMVQTEDD